MGSKYKVTAGKPVLIVLFSFILWVACSGTSVKEDKDSLGRTVKKTTYTSNRFERQEEIQYLGNTGLPLVKVYKRVIDGSIVPWWTEVFSYEGERVKEIKFFITVDDKRVLSGKIDYQYEDEKLIKIEYYSTVNIEKQDLNTHGFDLYYYSREFIVKRRIIEYEYNPETENNVQISQYVVSYEEGKVVSMETKMLDKGSREMITKNESNTEIISEMIVNIEKSLKDRCKGTSMLDR